jgi:ribosome-binding protein aMBF1 (putative translation factor)
VQQPHPLPDAALEADIAILGKKGRGKTFTAKGIVERLLHLGRRVIVLDPLSVWWGLKASADGKSPGYPIAIFGGPKADIPISGGSGHALGQLLSSTSISAVLDLGEMRKPEQARLVTDLLDHLFTVNRSPLWLVLEEADVFAPQQPTGEMTRALSEVDRIARRGRAFGFRLISITQRPAKLHKDVLTQLSTLITLGVTSPHDRDAIKAWVDGNADRTKAKDVYDSLAHLRVGEGWIWAPDLSLLQRVKFPPIATLDTSKTPNAGDAPISAPVFAESDIARLKAKLAQIEARDSMKAPTGTSRTRSASEPHSKANSRPPSKKRAPEQDPIAAALLMARMRAGLTQQQLADRLHTDQGNIARLERNRTQATVRTLKRVAEATGHELVVNFRRVSTKR